MLQGNNGKHWGLQDVTNYYTLPFCIPLPHFQCREDIYAHPCFQEFLKQFTDDYLSNHLYGQEARKVFIQHPLFYIEVFLKRMKDGWSIIHRHWPKVAKTFNMNEGSIFSFRFSSFSRWDASLYVPSMMLISKGSRCCTWNLLLVQLCNGVAECWSYIMLYSDVFLLWNSASLIWKWNTLCA